MLENAPDRSDEAHIEHLVSFIQNKDFEARKMSRSLAKVIKKSARRSDKNINAPFKSLLLRSMGDAAEDCRNRKAKLSAIVTETLGDLGRQFASGRQNKTTAP
jgi:hypothetical protein